MEIKFTTDNYPWSMDGLKSCIKDNKLKGVKILSENDYSAAVYIPSYQASVVLGAMSDWCISQHKCSWKQYVSDKNNVQMFFFDFTRKPSSELTLIGATYTNKDKLNVMCAFTRGNHPLHEIVKMEDDQTALYEKIISKNFSWPQIAVIDSSISNTFNGTKPAKENTTKKQMIEDFWCDTDTMFAWYDDEYMWDYSWGDSCTD